MKVPVARSMQLKPKKIWHLIRKWDPVEVGIYEVRTKDTTRVPTLYSNRLRYWDGQEWFLVLKDTLKPAERSIPLNESPSKQIFRRPKKNKQK